MFVRNARSAVITISPANHTATPILTGTIRAVLSGLNPGQPAALLAAN